MPIWSAETAENFFKVLHENQKTPQFDTTLGSDCEIGEIGIGKHV